jgi:hypothetical protein
VPSSNSIQRRADRAHDDAVVDSDLLLLKETLFDSAGANVFQGRPLLDSSSASLEGVKESAPSGNTDAVPTSLSVGAAPAVTIAEGASVEIAGASAQSVTFTGTTGTLKLDASLAFTGEISGLAGSDAIDLADVSYGIQTQVTFLGNTTGGTLTITDGIHTANLALQGDYLSSTWTLSSDGNGGTSVVDPVASSNWQTLKVGAGGLITGIDIAADGTEVIRTDTYGAYLWNGTQWQQLVTANSMPAGFVAAQFGNTAQGVYEIQIAPSNTNIFYMMYDGYVFESNNKGTTWTQTNLAQVTANPNAGGSGMGEKLAIDPNNPNIVYAGSANGLFVTTNGGTTWTSVSAVPVGLANVNGDGIYPTISGILFDPAIGGVVNGVTQTIFASSSGNGVYESTNGGTTWTHLNGGPNLVEDAAISNGAYYATDATTLWKYAGGVWTNLFTNSAGLPAFAINPTNPNEIVTQDWSGLLSISYDGGATWNGSWSSNQVTSADIPWLAAANTNSQGSFRDVTHVAFNPLNPNQLINTAGTGVWTATNPPSSYSGSSTVTWSDQSLGIEQLVANEIIVPPGGKPVLASWDRPFFYVNDPNSFPTTYGPVASSNIQAGWSVDYSSSTPSFVVGLTDHGLGHYSTDGGQTWNNFASEPVFPGQANGGTIAASTPQNIILAPGDGVQPYYTLNGGATWNPLNLPGVSDWSSFEGAYYFDERSITADRVSPNTFYLYYPGHGVYESTNGGVSWTQVYSGNDGWGTQWNGYITPFSWYNNELMSVPGEAGNLFFTGGPQGGDPTQNPFMRSTNGGATWTAIPNVLNVSCFGFGASATLGGYPAIYIVGYVNSVYGIWQSVNNAQSWTQIGTYPINSLDSIKTIAGDPNIFGQVYVGFMGSGYAVLNASSASTGSPITSIVASPSTGDLNAGKTVTFTISYSSTVTVAGGNPTLTLNDGGTASYTGGSGTNALTYTYTVGAGDSNVAALVVNGVNLNGATITDSGGNYANVSLAGVTQTGPQIDTATPVVSAIAETPSSGSLNAGKTVAYTITMSEAVTVNTAGGSPTLTLNDGGVATYTGGSGSNTLTFSYTVLAGQNTPDLMATAFNLNGATMADGAGNAANPSITGIAQGSPQIDTTTPTVASVVASGTGITAGAGDRGTGSVVTLTVNLSEAVTVAGGTPTLTLNDGGTASYTGGSGSSALTFSYTVGAGQNTADLAVTAVNLGAATVKDGAGNAADLTGAVTNPAGTLQIDSTAPTVSSVAASGTGITAGAGNLGVGGVVTLTVSLSEAVTVAGGTPTLTLNDGGTATYTGGSGSSALTFSYTVGAGQNTADLAVTAVNLGTATVKDGAGNAANLTGAVTNPAGTLQISTSGPTVSSVVASGTGITAGAGDLGAGSVVTLTVNLSSAVTVAGGIPTLTLNDGGTATYTGGSGSNALTFSYTVAAGQNTADLAVTAVNLGTATVKDGAGNTASLTGALTNPAGTLQIDTTAATVSSVVASGTGITAGTGDVGVGSVVTLTVNLSEAVTVAGGTPTLTLNDGGTATYTGGSGSSALTFSYTVGAGQNTADLAVSAVNLNSATITDGAGNAASLAGAATTPSGTLQIDTTASTVASVVGSGTGITAGAGDRGTGSVVTLTVNLSETVTVAGGTPTLTLNDGGTATYSGGSGSSALTFSYTVGAGQNTADLAVSAVNLGTATVKDGAGNAADLTGAVTNPAGTLQIDSTAPSVASVAASGTGITAGAGDLGVGSVVTLTVNLSEAVTVAGGTPTLTLNDGGTATYNGGSGSNALTFSYTVGVGQNTADLAVSAVNLGTATVKDGAGNAANLTGAVTNPSGTLQISTTGPTVSSVAASGTGITAGAGDLGAGSVVTLTVNLSSVVTVAGGTPTLALNDGGTATYTGGSGSNALTFSYTVGAGQNTADLAVTAVNLGTATVKDAAGNAANLTGAVTTPSGTLQIDTTAPTVSSVVDSGTGIAAGAGDLGTGSLVTLKVNLSEAVTVVGGTPTLTLNDGGTATYTGGSGSNALTFSYTVGAGQNTADLAVTAVSLNSATVTDGAGNAANLTGAVTNPAGTLQIDTTTPTLGSIIETPASGHLKAGKTVTLTLNMSEAVTVAGGVPTLTLNDGATATYTNGSGTNALTFSYTVAAGQNTASLAATTVNLNGAAIKNGAGTTASFATLSGLAQVGAQIDTTIPTVTQVVASPGSGTENPGAVITLTLDLSKAVTVTGTPTLTLNDGATATYTGGSGTNALTFSYTVAATDSTVPTLAITQVNLPSGATVMDAAGNAADLSGGVTTFPGLSIDPPPVVVSVFETPSTGDLNIGKTGTLTLQLNDVVTVTGGIPTLTLNDGGTATYTGGSGTNALTFSYTVGAGQNASSLAATAVNLNGATIQNSLGDAAIFLFNGVNQAGPQIDTTTPTVASVVTSGVGITGGTGDLPAGSVVTFTVNLSEAVTVAGGAPKLTLNDGGTATYTSGSGTSALTFSYTVAAGQNTADLAVTAVNLNSATVKDGAGNAADLSGAVTNPAGTLQIDTTTHLAQVGSNYFLDNINGSGPELKYGGAAVTVGEFGGWTPIGVVQLAGGGYDIAWKNTSTAQYTVWSTDSNGNYTANVIGTVSGSNSTLEALETTFNQDLNGDGTIGLPRVVIQTDGSTALMQVGNNFYLYNGGTGPALNYGGAAVTVGEFGSWTPIGAVQVAGGGYDIAWKNTATGQYTVWSTNSSGNYLSNIIGIDPGNSLAFETVETTFQQDLNGDGTIGPTTVVIQTDGATVLTEIANTYSLYTNGSGPSLKYGGAVVTAGAFGTWTPIGAVQVAGGGYDVAWKNTATGQYTVWSTDSSGNYTSNIGVVSGTSTALELLETTFNQDLNGDGTIGIPKVVIQTDGSTSLVQVGSNYFLYPVGGSSGPELQYGGAAVVAGQFGGWTVVGAELTSSGYDVAWKNASTGQYTVWGTDSNGNYTSNLIGVVSGNSTALETFENIFQQDLNGDGVVGIYAAPGTILQINSSLSGPSGSATIGTGATLELAAGDSSSVTFSSSTGMLKLDSPSTFNGVIFNFAGNGTLSGSDQIDLKGINFNTVQDSYSNGILTVTDGTHSAALDFNGSYTLANFKFASDGGGGTILYDPPASLGQAGNVGPEIMHDPGISGLDQQLALFSQHMASAFPSSAFGNDGASTVTPADLGAAQLSQITQPIANQQHA